MFFINAHYLANEHCARTPKVGLSSERTVTSTLNIKAVVRIAYHNIGTLATQNGHFLQCLSGVFATLNGCV